MASAPPPPFTSTQTLFRWLDVSTTFSKAASPLHTQRFIFVGLTFVDLSAALIKLAETIIVCEIYKRSSTI